MLSIELKTINKEKEKEKFIFLKEIEIKRIFRICGDPFRYIKVSEINLIKFGQDDIELIELNPTSMNFIVEYADSEVIVLSNEK